MKKYNFNAGPSILPQQVIKATIDACTDFENTGLSLMEISHRSKEFQPVMDNAEALALKLTECGVHILRNNMEQIKIGEDHINIYGTQLPQRFYRNEDFSHHDLPQITKDELTKLLGEPDKSECNFLLSHTPLAFRAYADWGADVTFSGHCHGGVIRLPFIGGILSPERKFFPRYTKGIYKLDAEQGLAKLAVTAGLGKFRLNNPSEIMICTLERQE